MNLRIPEMTSLSNITRTAMFGADDSSSWQSFRLALLIAVFTILCCFSLRLAFPHYSHDYILYDEAHLDYAIVSVAAFALVSPLFVFARFSFGYFSGFYFYTMIVGYLWINSFSHFQYNHLAAGFSAAISAVAFLLPAVLITSPVKQLYVMPERTFQHLLTLIMLFSAATATIAGAFNFRFVAVTDIYEFRDLLKFPTMLDYSIGATTSALLPFAFACHIASKKYLRAGIALLILLAFYPITLSKLALFTPAWLLTLLLVSRVFDAKATIILTLLLPSLLGTILIVVFGEVTRHYFDIVNLRMIIVPSSAMDVYNEYFARHELTYFCQIRILKPFIPCALEHSLAIEMRNTYALGNFNASLFATEGIASVGLLLAPFVTFVGGLVMALGNRVSAGLPPHFIMLSGAILPQILLNVPLTITLLTHGAAFLFLLWYVTPRSIFTREVADRHFCAIDRPGARG
jgi:hypothetical protein